MRRWNNIELLHEGMVINIVAGYSIRDQRHAHLRMEEIPKKHIPTETPLLVVVLYAQKQEGFFVNPQEAIAVNKRSAILLLSPPPII